MGEGTGWSTLGCISAGARDGARTRDLRRDRPECSLAISTDFPIEAHAETAGLSARVGPMILAQSTRQILDVNFWFRTSQVENPDLVKSIKKLVPQTSGGAHRIAL